MGCDGGTIPKRDELVKTRKKKEQKDKVSERIYKWKHCSVSQIPLKTPVVACELGRIYNKEEVITRLLNKTQVESNIGHIRGLKDVKELNFTKNPSYNAAQDSQKGGESVENTQAAWMCPVTSMEMNGKHGFMFLWGCGCVISSRAVNEVKSDSCLKCGAKYDTSDVITLNPSDIEVEELTLRMEERRVRAKEAKRLAKRKAETDESSTEVSVKKEKKSKVIKSAGASSSKSGVAVSGLASSILRDSEFSGVRDKNSSIAKDPKHSEVYKSIFDTHKSAEKKLKSHWVTCNPLYY